jgi:hypothetical protein
MRCRVAFFLGGGGGAVLCCVWLPSYLAEACELRRCFRVFPPCVLLCDLLVDDLRRGLDGVLGRRVLVAEPVDTTEAADERREDGRRGGRAARLATVCTGSRPVKRHTQMMLGFN